MKKFKSRLTKKEKLQITTMIQEIPDYFGDFYLTKNNLRLFIKDNLSLLFDGLKRGDKIAYNDSGLAIVTGFSDKNPRKYIKFLVKDDKSANDLLQILYTKLKKRNPLIKVLQTNNFEWFASRGKEILLVRKYIKMSLFNKKEKITC